MDNKLGTNSILCQTVLASDDQSCTSIIISDEMWLAQVQSIIFRHILDWESLYS